MKLQEYLPDFKVANAVVHFDEASPLADQLQEVGELPLLKYFLDGSRHVFKVDDIAYNKQVFPVVAGQIGIGCCKREDKRMQKERFYLECGKNVFYLETIFT